MFRWANASSNDGYYWQSGIDQSSVRAASYQWATYYWARVINFLFSLVGSPQIFPFSRFFIWKYQKHFFFYLYFSPPHSARFHSLSSRIFWKETEEDVDDPAIHCALTINWDIVRGLKNQLHAIDCIEYCCVFLCDNNVILFNHAAAKWCIGKRTLNEMSVGFHSV